MKKSTIIITSVICGSIILLGCTNPSTPANISKNLENNLNSLTSAINRLDTIDNSYLSNPDIYPITNSITNTPAPESNKNLVAKIKMDNFNLLVPVAENKQKIAKLNLSLENDFDIQIETDTLTHESMLDESNNETSVSTFKESNNEENNTTLTLENNNFVFEENKNNETQNTTNDETMQTTNYYYYDIRPVRYAPRYSKSVTTLENEDYLTNYISKVRTLYAITNDAIEANSALSDCKNNVIAYCVEIKDLNSNIKNGTFIPTSQQIAALNNYIDDIKITIKRIKKCNGDLTDEVNSINKTDVGGIIAGIDVVNSNYLSVLNHLDTRITYLKNALTTLEQVKYLLQEAQNIVETNPTTPQEIVTPEIINPSNPITPEITETENNNISEENINNDEPVNNAMEENVNSENANTELEDNNLNDNNSNDDNNSNIDTYLNTNNNLDTFNNENNENLEHNENVENNNINNENNGLNNSGNLNTTNNENLDENNTLNNNSSDINLNNNTNSNLNNNGLNGINNGLGGVTLPTDDEEINAPNGTFQNGIITQNNLNNGVNNGVNGTNTGYGSSNNYPYINGDINRTNNNVDTYGYNTMIDMLNRGTVNNGINTLNVTEDVSTKPSMVNGDVEIKENIIDSENMEETSLEELENNENDNIIIENQQLENSTETNLNIEEDVNNSVLNNDETEVESNNSEQETFNLIDECDDCLETPCDDCLEENELENNEENEIEEIITNTNVLNDSDNNSNDDYEVELL